MRFIARIIGSIISGILSKILAFAAIAAGMQYFLTGSVSTQPLVNAFNAAGGASGIAAMAKEESAGLGAFTGLLGAKSPMNTAKGADGSTGLGGAFGVPQGVSSQHYPAKARIARIEVHCRLLDLKSIPATQTKSMPCIKAFELKTNPAFAAHDLKETRTIEYIYYAKDGTSVLTGRFVPEGHRLYRVGDVVDVEVSKRTGVARVI